MFQCLTTNHKGDATLVQKTRNDNYSGDCDGSGQNVMGKILMKVRKELEG